MRGHVVQWDAEALTGTGFVRICCCDAEKMIQLEEHATCAGESLCAASRWKVWVLFFVKFHFFLGDATDTC